MRNRTASLSSIPPCLSSHQLDLIVNDELSVLQPREPRMRRSHSVTFSRPSPKKSLGCKLRSVSLQQLPMMSIPSPPSSPLSSQQLPSFAEPSPPSSPVTLPTPATPPKEAMVDNSTRGQPSAAINGASRTRLSLLSCSLVASGVLTNVAFEKLSKSEPGCTGLLTFAQYVVALIGGVPSARKHLSSPAIPFRVHMAFTLLMFVTAYAGNRSVEFSLPFPIYLIIKSSNLIASMAVGCLFGKAYTRGQAMAVLVMTAGVVLATLANSSGGSSTAAASMSFDTQVLAGASLCALSTLSMALLGCYQESAFRIYGQHHKEAIFYIHALGLPPLLWLQAESPVVRLRRWLLEGAPAQLWALLVLNLVACQLCKRSFFALLGATSSLTASLGVLGYRFVGILLSGLWFNAPPPPPPLMIVGAGLVTTGGLGYLHMSASPSNAKAKQS